MRYFGRAFIAHVPDKSVEPGFGRQSAFGRARSKTFIIAAFSSRLRLRRIFADDLAILVQNLKRDGRGFCGVSGLGGDCFSLWRNWSVRGMRLSWLFGFCRRLFGWSCGRRRRAAFFLFFRLLLTRFLQRRLQRVIDHSARRRILSAIATAAKEAAAKCR